MRSPVIVPVPAPALPRPAPSTHVRSSRIGPVTVLGTGRWRTPIVATAGVPMVAVRGRRGAGKTTVAVNLAVALAELRPRILLVDLDVERPTLHRLFGIETPVAGLKALLDGEVDTLDQALTPTGIRNLYLVSAAGAADAARRPLDAAGRQRLIEQLDELGANVIIADVWSGGGGAGGGTGPKVGTEIAEVFAASALRIVVAAPEADALEGTFGVFRDEALRALGEISRRGSVVAAAAAAAVSAALAGAPTAAGAPMHELVAAAAAAAGAGGPEARAAIATALEGAAGRIVGNRCRDTRDQDLLHAVRRLVENQLGIEAPILGVVDANAGLDADAGRGRPLGRGRAADRNARLFQRMAEQILADRERPGAAIDAATETAAWSSSGDGSGDGGGALPAGMPALPAPLQRFMRRQPRHMVDWRAVFVSDGGWTSTVRVHDVSATGVCIQAPPGLSAGERGRLVFTHLPGRPALRASTVWVRAADCRSGLDFTSPIEPAAAAIASAAAADAATALPWR